jgi:hypothetical protein
LIGSQLAPPELLVELVDEEVELDDELELVEDAPELLLEEELELLLAQVKKALLDEDAEELEAPGLGAVWVMELLSGLLPNALLAVTASMYCSPPTRPVMVPEVAVPGKSIKLLTPVDTRV